MIHLVETCPFFYLKVRSLSLDKILPQQSMAVLVMGVMQSLMVIFGQAGITLIIPGRL